MRGGEEGGESVRGGGGGTIAVHWNSAAICSRAGALPDQEGSINKAGAAAAAVAAVVVAAVVVAAAAAAVVAAAAAAEPPEQLRLCGAENGMFPPRMLRMRGKEERQKRRNG